MNTRLFNILLVAFLVGSLGWTYADASTASWEYDSNDALSAKTDRNGSVSSYSYDGALRLTSIGITRGTGVAGTTLQNFAYDDAGKLTQVFDNNNPDISSDDATVSFEYDTLDRLTKETQNGKSITSAYDAASNRTSLNWVIPGTQH